MTFIVILVFCEAFGSNRCESRQDPLRICESLLFHRIAGLFVRHLRPVLDPLEPHIDPQIPGTHHDSHHGGGQPGHDANEQVGKGTRKKNIMTDYNLSINQRDC